MEIFCMGYGPSYVMHQNIGLSHRPARPDPPIGQGSPAASLSSILPGPRLTGNALLNSCSFSEGTSMPAYATTLQHANAIQLRNRNVHSVDELPLGIRTAWNSWSRFVIANSLTHPLLSPLLLDVSELQAMIFIAEYAHHLLTVLNFALPYVSTVIDNLNGAFQVHGRIIKVLFQTTTNLLLKQTYSVAQLAEAPLQRERVLNLLKDQPQPIPLSLITHMFNRYWVPGSWVVAEDICNRGYFLIEALSMALGIRSSSLCVGDLVTRLGRRVSLNHYLHACDITFYLASSPTSDPLLIVGGDNHLRAALGWPAQLDLDSVDPMQWKSISRADVRCVTSKATNSVGKRLKKRLATAHPITRGQPIETQLLDCLIAFELSRNIPGDSPYFARRHPDNGSILNLRTKESVEALRTCADELNLPRQSFTSKSGRITLSTVAEEASLPQEVINDMGGWAPGSTVSRSSYSRARPPPNVATLFDRVTSETFLHH